MQIKFDFWLVMRVSFLSLCWTQWSQCSMSDNASAKCSTARLDHCLQPLANLTIDRQLSHPTSEAKLNHTCRVLKAVDNCTNEIVQLCSQVQVNHMFREMIEGTRLMMYNICRNGPVRNEYLTYAKCYYSVTNRHCRAENDRFDALLRTIVKQTQKDPQDSGSKEVEDHNRLKRFCCAYKWNSDCETYHITKHCTSDGAVHFYHHYNSRITDTVLQQHCLAFAECTEDKSPTVTDQHHTQAKQLFLNETVVKKLGQNKRKFSPNLTTSNNASSNEFRPILGFLTLLIGLLTKKQVCFCVNELVV